MTPVHRLKNIGPQMTQWLARIGIHGEDDIAALGVIEVYRRLKAANPDRASLNALWALQGALLGLHWNDLPPGMKDALKRQLRAADQAGSSPVAAPDGP